MYSDCSFYTLPLDQLLESSFCSIQYYWSISQNLHHKHSAGRTVSFKKVVVDQLTSRQRRYVGKLQTNDKRGRLLSNSLIQIHLTAVDLIQRHAGTVKQARRQGNGEILLSWFNIWLVSYCFKGPFDDFVSDSSVNSSIIFSEKLFSFHKLASGILANKRFLEELMKM